MLIAHPSPTTAPACRTYDHATSRRWVGWAVVQTFSTIAFATALAVVSRPANAEPQATAGLTVGLAGVGTDDAAWARTVFHGGLRGDVLLGRSGNDDFGLGPYAELLTHGFDDLQFGGGLSALLPVLDSWPIVLSAGGYGRSAGAARGVEPGLAGGIFWGSRSYNFHGSYVMTAGLLAQGRLGLGKSAENSFVVSAQLDLAVVALPVVFLINAVRGESEDAAPVR